MALPLIDRQPTNQEFQKLRLLLSTFQDGTGMNMVSCRIKTKNEKGKQVTVSITKNFPGWRDFERVVAIAFDGEAQESKAIFDVLLTNPKTKIKYGISCKMREDFNATIKTGRVNLELSNAAGKFWAELKKHGLNQENYMNDPTAVAQIILNLYKSWHQDVSIENGGIVDTSKSCYLALSWDRRSKNGMFQFHQFPLQLPDVDSIQWTFSGRRILGINKSGMIFEWYGESGGQLKYYPPSVNATWKSDPFELEPLGDIRYGILHKAEAYFPELWVEAYKEE
jgi:hypothetical protein